MIEQAQFSNQASIETEESGSIGSFRPQTLHDFVGQDEIKQSLEVFIQAAKIRNTALDHVFLYGPPGLGKTSLATIIAHELGASLKSISAVALEKSGDLIAVLSSLTNKTVLFIDEIHRLKKPLEEILYTAMEDSFIDVLMGQGTGAQAIRLRLEPFTLIGATTQPGGITQALHSRFGITYNLSFYKGEDIQRMLEQQLVRLGLTSSPEGTQMLSHRCRYTPRHGLRLLRRCIDYAQVHGDARTITKQCVEATLADLQIDSLGLDNMSNQYLQTLCTQFGGGPVGIQSISAGMGCQGNTLEETVEPYLLRIGMIQRTSQGRVALEKSYRHLKISPKESRHLLWNDP